MSLERIVGLTVAVDKTPKIFDLWTLYVPTIIATSDKGPNISEGIFSPIPRTNDGPYPQYMYKDFLSMNNSTKDWGFKLKFLNWKIRWNFKSKLLKYLIN